MFTFCILRIECCLPTEGPLYLYLLYTCTIKFADTRFAVALSSDQITKTSIGHQQNYQKHCLIWCCLVICIFSNNKIRLHSNKQYPPLIVCVVAFSNIWLIKIQFPGFITSISTQTKIDPPRTWRRCFFGAKKTPTPRVKPNQTILPQNIPPHHVKIVPTLGSWRIIT